MEKYAGPVHEDYKYDQHLDSSLLEKKIMSKAGSYHRKLQDVWITR